MDKLPLVVQDGQLQQLQQGDVLSDSSLPYDRENNVKRLLQMLLVDLAVMGFPLRAELLAEISKNPI